MSKSKGLEVDGGFGMWHSLYLVFWRKPTKYKAVKQ
jgi:hypothetical protein